MNNPVAEAWRLRWWLAVLVAMGLAGAITTVILATPVYRAELKAFPVQTNTTENLGGGALGTLAGIVGVDVSQGISKKYEALEILRSHTFLSSFIREEEILKVLFEDQWDPNEAKWVTSRWGFEPEISDGVRKFQEKILSVAEDRRTGVITIGIEWHDRERAADWANILVRRLNREMRERALRETADSLAYLNTQVEKTQNVEVKTALYRLIEAEVKRAMLAQVKEDYALRVFDSAIAPDPRDAVWPRPFLMLIGGLSMGAIAAMTLFLFVRLRNRIKALREADHWG